MSKGIFKLLNLGLALCLFSFVSCASNNQNKSSLRGNIVIDGSSTVYPITEIVAEEFSIVNPKIRISIAESGTGGGMKKFIEGEIDIVNASRKIKDSELEQAKNNGIDAQELIVAK